MTQQSHGAAVAALLAVLALLMSLKYFPGLENETAYAGNVYQTIHPDAFAGDVYRGPEQPVWQRPLQLSAMYALVKAVGTTWLDDRFMFLVYWLLVAVGLAGVDRTAKLLGASGLHERAIILFLFLKDHAVLDHKVLLAHHADINHTAFAIPIIVWLIYATLARNGVFVVLALAALLALFSVRNAAFPVAICLIITAVIGSKRDRITAVAIIAAAVGVAYWALFHKFAVPEASRLELWRYIAREEEGDTNPFTAIADGHWLPVATWAAVIVGGFLAARGDEPQQRGVRIYMVLGGLTFLAGGAYITFAPDGLKFPLLIGFAPNRSLAWAQNLAYIAIAVGLFRWTATAPAPRKIAVTATALAALFILGPGNIERWTGLVAASAIAAVALHWFGRPRILTGRMEGVAFAAHVVDCWRVMVIHALTIAVAVSYAVAIVDKAPAWKVALATGVFGDAASARWIGVAEHIRDHVPADASVLPISFKKVPYYPRTPSADGAGGLVATRSLGTRAGRAMPVPQTYGVDFRSPAAWRRIDQQRALLDAITDALSKRDNAAAAAAIAGLLPVPDYIVLPEAALGGADAAIGPYRVIDRVRGYALLGKDGG